MVVVAKSFIHSLNDIAFSYDYFLVYVLIPLESYSYGSIFIMDYFIDISVVI